MLRMLIGDANNMEKQVDKVSRRRETKRKRHKPTLGSRQELLWCGSGAREHSRINATTLNVGMSHEDCQKSDREKQEDNKNQKATLATEERGQDYLKLPTSQTT